MTVVCVDDHRILLNGITETVKQTLSDASINSFVSANEAFAFAKGNGCDILICEIDLHDMSGITLAKQIKKLNPGEKPTALFALAEDKAIAVYEYCNLHGLWKTEL